MKQRINRPQASDNPLGTAPVFQLIAKFAIPTIISMLVNSAYNMTDQVFIGHSVGMLGNAATNVAFPIVNFSGAFCQLVGVGTAANFNMSMGADKKDEAERFVGTGLSLIPLAGLIIMTLVLCFKTRILELFGATASVLPYAKMYLSITVFGIPFQMFSFAGSFLVRADGSPAYSMACTSAGAVLNIFLDWLLMFKFNLGIQGAAMATVASQVFSGLLCLSYFFRFKTFKIRFRHLRFRLKYVFQIAKLGLSNFFNHLMMMLVNIVMNNTLTHYGAMSVYGGDIPLAVSGVVGKVNSILSAVTIGLAQGAQPIWSYNMGAKNYARVKSAYKKALSAALVMNMLTFILLQTFPRQIVSIFGTGDELYFEFAERYTRIFLFMVFVFGVQIISVNYFTGIGEVKQGIVLSLSRQGLFMLPLLVLLPRFFGLDGALYAGPAADLMACLLAAVLVHRDFRKFDRKYL